MEGINFKKIKGMKTLYKILTLLTVVPFLVLSCKQKEEPYSPGAEEDENCYGVYFPKQTIPSELDPSAELEFTIQVNRTNASGDITVPIVVKQDEEVFEFGTLSFENGEEETELLVKFPKMTELNKEYSCTVSVEDPAYAKLYGTTTTDLTFTVSRVKWNDLEYTDPKTGEKITEATYVDDVLSTFFSVGNPAIKVKAQEHSQIPGYYRIESPYCEKYPYNDPGDWDDSKQYYLYFHAEDPDFVWIPRQETGLDWGYGNVAIWSDAGWNIENDGKTLAEAKQLGNGGTLFKGVIKFPAKAILMNMPNYSSSWYFANNNGAFRLILPGGVETDYSWSIEQSGLSEDGIIPVNVTLGADIASVKYKTYEGAVTGEDLDAALAEVKEDTNLSTVTETSTLELSFEKSGVYTLIAAASDADGGDQGAKAITLYYLAEGDEAPVSVEARLQNISLEDLSEGVSAENNLSFMIKGENLTEVKCGVFKLMDVNADYEGVLEELEGMDSVDDKILSKINGNGYVGTVSGLIPGTEFILFVWATNGYEETLVHSTTVTTAGDPLPIYQSFDFDSYDDEFEPTSQDDIIGTWNYYGIEYFSNKSGVREYMGKVTISDSETTDEGPDEDGLLDEYVSINGLSGGLIKGLPDDSMEADLYGGILYFPIKNKDASGVNVYTMTSTGSAYNSTYNSGFIPVMDGYYAFVHMPNANDYTGIAWYSGGFLGWYYDLLLVKPEVDNNGKAPSMMVVDYAVSKKLQIIDGYFCGEKQHFKKTGKKDIHSSGILIANEGIHFGLKSANVKVTVKKESKAAFNKQISKSAEKAF